MKYSRGFSNQSLGKEDIEGEGDSWPRSSKPQSFCTSRQESRIADFYISFERQRANSIWKSLIKPSIGVTPLGNRQIRVRSELLG